MNPATLQRGTHALFSLLAIRAPIEDDLQHQLRTGMRATIELLRTGHAENKHMASLIEWVAVTRAMIKPPVYAEALIPTVAAGLAVQNILDAYATRKVWRITCLRDLDDLNAWLPWFEAMVAAANKWEINAAAQAAEKTIRAATRAAQEPRK